MDNDGHQLLCRVLSDATNQVYHNMLERVQKGDALGHLRGPDGNVGSIPLPQLYRRVLTTRLPGPRCVLWSRPSRCICCLSTSCDVWEARCQKPHLRL